MHSYLSLGYFGIGESEKKPVISQVNIRRVVLDQIQNLASTYSHLLLNAKIGLQMILL